MTNETEESGANRIPAAFERISRWMTAHGAPLLAENLAPGAAPERLARAEVTFGIALLDDLRALWSSTTETPLLDQFCKGLDSRDTDRCAEVLKDALDREDKEAFGAAIALLFGSKAEPKFVAGALRTLLKTVTLSPDQWVDVAMGGALLENNAVRDAALSHFTGVSAERLIQLAASVTAAPQADRAALDDVLKKVRAKTPAETIAQADAAQGSWWSRLFKTRPPKA